VLQVIAFLASDVASFTTAGGVLIDEGTVEVIPQVRGRWLDGFVDEDVDYAMRLNRAGAATELHVYPGACHRYFVVEDCEITCRANATSSTGSHARSAADVDVKQEEVDDHSRWSAIHARLD